MQSDIKIPVLCFFIMSLCRTRFSAEIYSAMHFSSVDVIKVRERTGELVGACPLPSHRGGL